MGAGARAQKGPKVVCERQSSVNTCCVCVCVPMVRIGVTLKSVTKTSLTPVGKSANLFLAHSRPYLGVGGSAEAGPALAETPRPSRLAAWL